MWRTVFPLLCAAMLSGCSYAYDIEAVVSGGQLTFSANPQWGKDCVRQIFVGEVSKEGIEDAGVMWDRSITYDDGCVNTFPIAYGYSLKGKRHAYDGQPARSIGPKPLRREILYEVHATTGATGYGCGQFRINSHGEVKTFACR